MLSLTATVLFIALILVILIVLVRKKTQRKPNQSTENDVTINTAVYEEIELHPLPSANIDTRENVAYCHTKVFST